MYEESQLYEKKWLFNKALILWKCVQHWIHWNYMKAIHMLLIWNANWTKYDIQTFETEQQYPNTENLIFSQTSHFTYPIMNAFMHIFSLIFSLKYIPTEGFQYIDGKLIIHFQIELQKN